MPHHANPPNSEFTKRILPWRIVDFSIFILFFAGGLQLTVTIRKGFLEFDFIYGMIISFEPMVIAMGFAISMTALLSIIPLRKMSLRRQDQPFGGPGLTACWAIVVLSIIYTPLRLFGLTHIKGEFDGIGFMYWLPTLFSEQLPLNGSAILIAWLNTCLHRKWELEQLFLGIRRYFDRNIFNYNIYVLSYVMMCHYSIDLGNLYY